MSYLLRRSLTEHRKLASKIRKSNKYLSRLMGAYLLNIVDIVEKSGKSVDIVNPMYSFRHRTLRILKDGVTEYPSEMAIERGEKPTSYSLEEFRNRCKTFDTCEATKFEETLHSIESSWIKRKITLEMVKTKLATLNS